MTSRIFSILLSLLFYCSFTSAQITGSTSSASTSSTEGFNANGNKTEENREGWLKSHDFFIFGVILCFLLTGVLIWYITRSIRSMRERLDEENQHNLMMIQNTMGPKQAMMETIPSDGFHKVPVYVPQQPPQYTHRY